MQKSYCIALFPWGAKFRGQPRSHTVTCACMATHVPESPRILESLISEGHLGLFTKTYTHKNNPLYGILHSSGTFLSMNLSDCRMLTTVPYKAW